ncbi:MAG: Uma2 family endonuclease [Elusimicrobiota bacterium]|nr:Uma2 family endonuclease [Elusimicrobiota bacterium]
MPKKMFSSKPSRSISKIAEDKLTYSDYCLLPDDGKRYEIIDGELYNAPTPFTHHQSISRNMLRIIANYCFEYHHGQVWYAPIDIIFSEIDIVQPDIVWVIKQEYENRH